MEFFEVVGFASEVATVYGARVSPGRSRVRLMSFTLSHSSLLNKLSDVRIVRHNSYVKFIEHKD